MAQSGRSLVVRKGAIAESRRGTTHARSLDLRLQGEGVVSRGTQRFSPGACRAAVPCGDSSCDHA